MYTLYTYLDSSRLLVDYAINPPLGAIGSNWSVREDYITEKEAHDAGEEYLKKYPSFMRMSETNPTF